MSEIIHLDPRNKDTGVEVIRCRSIDEFIDFLYAGEIAIPDIGSIFDEASITYRGVPVAEYRASLDPNNLHDAKLIESLNKSLSVARRIYVRSARSQQ